VNTIDLSPVVWSPEEEAFWDAVEDLAVVPTIVPRQEEG
jgi:hypothetical protein